MTLAQVANDRDGVMDLLAVDDEALEQHTPPASAIRHRGHVDEAVKAGKLSRHRLDGIELADDGRYSRKSFGTHVRAGKFVADGGINPDTSAPSAVLDCACGLCAAVACVSKRR